MIAARIACGLCAATLLAALACGGSSSDGGGTSPSPTCNASPNTTTITISNNAVCPQNITVSRGAQVTFVNNDTRNHQMDSDPHPEHTDCPEINQVDFLAPGQSRQTGNLVTPRRCGFHDHQIPSNSALRGSITVQ
jgi:plastocyanin